MIARSIFCALFTVLICGMLPTSHGIPTTVTSSSSSSSSSSATMVNGRLVSGHCDQSKNGVAAGCGNPVLGAVPDVITTITPGFMAPPMMPGFGFPPSMPGFGFPSAMPGFGFPPSMPGFGVPLGMPGIGDIFGMAAFPDRVGPLGFH